MEGAGKRVHAEGKRVTLRRLLSHTAGLTVHGFPGYEVHDGMPSVVQVLDGAGNTPPVRVDVVPGSISRYSGGGYTVMQQLVIDVTGKPFPQYMTETVLAPAGMTSSTYQQPPPPDRAAQTASGQYSLPVPGSRPMAPLSRDGGRRPLDDGNRPRAVCD